MYLVLAGSRTRVGITPYAFGCAFPGRLSRDDASQQSLERRSISLHK
jgi:hypothetical protein